MSAASIVSALVLVAATSLVGCDESSAVKEPVVDASPAPTSPPTSTVPSADGGPLPGDGGARDCVENPRTHAEIVNGCTNAVRIAKNPVLPKLLADGGLPPLP